MAKNKKSAPKMELLMNDKNYVKSGRARKLPIYDCLINENWKETGLAHIFVIREHVNGNLTVGAFLVDVLCVGLKDTFYRFNIAPWEFDEIIEVLDEATGEMVSCDYDRAHNIVYGGIEFANEFGIPPAKEFETTSMILEEDDENVPLIDIDFGREGVPVLIGDPSDPKTKNYLSILKRNAGEGNYEFEPFYFEDDDDEIEDLNLENDFEDWNDENYEDEEEDDPANWGYEDWEAFVKDTSPAIWGFNEAATYFYERILMRQDLASLSTSGENEVLNFKVTYEPIEFEYRLSAEEQKEGELIHRKLGNSLSKKEFIDLEKRLLDNIQKWPKARIFHNQLTTFYSQSGDDTKLDAALKNMVGLFPNYLFGKLALAQRLIAHRKLEEVPALFAQQFSLKAIYPERDTFHISEMVSFHTIMCLYFMEKEDLFSAMTHRHLALGMEIPEEISVNWNVFNKLDIKVTDRVKSYLDEIRDDEIKIKETITQLTEPTDFNLN